VTPLILFLAAQAASAPAAPAAVPPQLKACADEARANPELAIARATDWRVRGGGLDARFCLGLAYAAAERWPSAATVFEQAALEAEALKDGRRSDFWVQSGNASLAAGDAAKARKAFDAALAAGMLAPELMGEVHFDRARAAVALNDLVAARADIDQGLKLVPADPFGWYLSAALARRENNLKRAQDDIARAVAAAPGDAAILVEAGNIAGLSGEVDAAQALFQRAVRAEPNSPAAKAAQAALSGEAAPAPAASAAAATPAPAKPAPRPAEGR
jgi:tetratricopeptide (TPR) repeat protein